MIVPLLALVAWAGALPLAGRAAWGNAAPDSDTNLREAAKHFQQGVSFYGEADYRSALVEFRRASVLAPSSAVLYNIAETEYQLRDYAAALRTFERYVSAVGPGDPRRTEVEANIKVLRARVGHLTVTTVPAGAEVAVDDQPMGRTPFTEPLTVNVGHLKVVAYGSDHLPVTQYVDVAAEDKVAISLALALPGAAPPDPGYVRVSEAASPVAAEPPRRPWLRRAAWVGAGVAAAGALTFGILAHNSSDDLVSARRTYPLTTDRIDELASRTTTYAVLTDVLAVTAIAVGAWAFYSDSSNSSARNLSVRDSAARDSSAGNASVEYLVGPRSAGILTTF